MTGRRAGDAGTGGGRPIWRRGDEPEFSRIFSFTDAVFAIALTLLALDLRIDRVVGDASSPSAMWAALGDLGPQLIAFAVAFGLLARYWRAHHRLMSRVDAIDPTMLTLILVHLGFVALLPLPASMIGEWEQNPVSGVLFALNLAAISLLETIELAHAQRRGLLRDRDDATTGGDREEVAASLAPTLTFVVTLPLAFVSPTVMLLSWAVVGPALGWATPRLTRAG